MGLTLIFKWRGSGLKVRRSDVEKNLKADGWGSSMSEEERDKLDYLERKAAQAGVEGSLFLKGHTTGKVK